MPRQTQQDHSFAQAIKRAERIKRDQDYAAAFVLQRAERSLPHPHPSALRELYGLPKLGPAKPTKKRGLISVRPRISRNKNADALTQTKGRPPKRSVTFTKRAGDLWREARTAHGAKVPDSQLKQIANVLDRLKFVPPAEYLEGNVAQDVRKFNSHHSNSKDGPIKTWIRLVENGDKDHLRGMRRLLSRCSKTTAIPLSGK